MDKVRKSDVPSHSKQWTTFFEKKILHDPTHKEIERQEKLLADNYDKKLLSCASTTEDLRHWKTRRFIDKNERQVRREGYGVKEYLLQPLRRVTSFSTGYYDHTASPANNVQLCRHKLNRKPARTSWNYHHGVTSVVWCDEISQEQRESLEKCLQVNAMTLNQNVGQRE
jgi:hypothetical protein